MKILVTGGYGMLARDLVPALGNAGHDVVARDRDVLDITKKRSVASFIEGERPDVVVQCAAYTAVDAAEQDEAGAWAVNVEGTLNVARACQTVGALFVYPSTDYVFSGRAARPWLPEDPVDPVNTYGKSKREGELAAQEAGRTLVARTCWLYGAGGKNFVDTILSLARERDRLDVVNDQIGRPTWTASLSDALVELIEMEVSGTFHVSDGGEPVSWHGFAEEILARAGVRTPVRAVPSEAFPRPAPRPAYSVLDCSATERILGRPLRDWKDSLAAYLETSGPRGPEARQTGSESLSSGAAPAGGRTVS